MPKVTVIANPISGTHKKGKIISYTLDRLRASGYEVEYKKTEYHGHATEIAAQAVAEGIPLIIAIGGDGTVNEVATAMVGKDSVLGIIPCGSGNGLARHLGLPMSSKKAVDVIIDGHTEKIDACKVNGHYFFCTFGMGFDAEVAAHFAEHGKRGIFNYIKSAVYVNRHYSPEYYVINSPDENIEDRFLIVTVGNASQYGNNAFIAPRASIKDGSLDIVLIHPTGLPGRLKMALQMFTKSLSPGKKIKMFQAPEITVANKEHNRFHAHLDGESVSFDDKLFLECIPSALKVIVPENKVSI